MVARVYLVRTRRSAGLDGTPDYLGPPDYTVLGLFGPH